MDKILIVDDTKLNRDILSDIFEDRFIPVCACDGEEAIQILSEKKDEFAAILLDLVMPNKNGFEVLSFLNQERIIYDTPVLMITSEDDSTIESAAFMKGVSDFIRKPFNAIIVKKRVENVVELYSHKHSLEDLVSKQTNELKQQNILLRQQSERLHFSNTQLIDILGALVESRDLESGQHINRVRLFTQILANEICNRYPEYQITPAYAARIAAASPLHDIGKVAIPDSILLKPARLEPEEFEVMKTHATRGAEFIEGIQGIWDDDYRNLCYIIARHHHERYDGSGYPDHLIGDSIPIEAQIVSIADVYDALVSTRVYKKAYSLDDAFAMIVNGDCGQFNPKLVDCLISCKDQLEKVVRENI